MAGSGSNPSQLQVQTTCTWSPSSNSSWIQIAPASNVSTTGNGTVNYTVTANGCVTSRSGSITVATVAQLAITQDGSPANFAFSPTSESYAAAVTNGRITITTGAGCDWNAFSDVSWLPINSGSSGSGNGAITIQVVANNSVARTGNLHINDGVSVLLLPVTQAAAPPPPVGSR